MRTTKNQRILNLAVQKNLSIPVIHMLSFLLNHHENGIIKDYILSFQESLVKEVFANSYTRYLDSYKILNEEKFIESRGLSLHLLVWNYEHLNCIILNRPKRKYSITPAIERQGFIDSFNRINNLINHTNEDNKLKSVNINWDKIKGLRLPRSMEKLFSGKLEDRKFNYTKEKIRYLLGLIYLADTCGRIYNFNIACCCEAIAEVFESGTVSRSTCYHVHNKLLEEGIIREYQVEESRCIVIEDYHDGFRYGYIVVPYLVFKKAFKQLETAAIKICFDTLFKLNNGEDKKGLVKERKFIVVTVTDMGYGTLEDKQKIYKRYMWVRKRCFSEFINLFSGGGNTGLKEFFDMDLGFMKKFGQLRLRIKKQYFVRKKEYRFHNTGINPLILYKRKKKLIKRILNGYSLPWLEEDLKMIVLVFRRETSRVIRLVLKRFSMEVFRRHEEGLLPVKCPGAFINEMYKRYLRGSRIEILSATDEALLLKKEVFERSLQLAK